VDVLNDILRFQLVYAVSAFDRFMHEIIKIGIVHSFSHKTQLTKKAESFNISFSTVNKILAINKSDLSPRAPEDTLEYWIDREIYEQHKSLSFQQPEKIKDALSLIWNEEHKWQKIVSNMTIKLSGDTINEQEKYLKQTITLIVERRHQIVHEADIDLVTNKKRLVDKININESVNVIENLGSSIYKCVNNHAPN
jgi:hypothetical protein